MGVIYGTAPQLGDGSGYGYGYSDGDGSGDGYGSGYGYSDGDGYGYGSGYGYSDGDGSGDGSGYGYGYSDGDGYGYGYGYSDGDGSGYGYGYSDGSGYGYGYSDGDGSGYGYGYGDGYGYLEAVIASHISNHKELTDKGLQLAFWRSAKDGRPSNGGEGEPAHVGMIQEESGPLVPCRKGALHATMNPPKWKGERLWIVALHPPVVKVDDDKFASLKREILAEIPNFFE